MLAIEFHHNAVAMDVFSINSSEDRVITYMQTVLLALYRFI